MEKLVRWPARVFLIAVLSLRLFLGSRKLWASRSSLAFGDDETK